MVEDVVRALGFLCLGSRFKRLGERLQADTQRLLVTLDGEVQVGQYPLLAAIDRLGPLTIGEIAEAIGISQPGATRSLAQLNELGLITSRPAPDDQRVRVVSLTPKGQALIDRAKRDAWPRVEAAVADLCAPLAGPLLSQLAALEDGLQREPLRSRAIRLEGDADAPHA
jgi:DNA-binding MarR family transcriptional regulator